VSAPRYRVTLEVEGVRVTMRLKSIVGDADGVAYELDSFTLAALARQVASRWAEEHPTRAPGRLPNAPLPAPGELLCDTCGVSFSQDTIHTVVATDSLAGAVMCQECRV